MGNYTHAFTMLELATNTATAVLLFKILALSPLTSAFRFVYGQFCSAEDTKANKSWSVGLQAAMPIVRVRNAQRNDMENVYIALLLWLAAPSSLINPTFVEAFTAARCAHTVCYLAGLQPWRAISYIVGHVLNAVMLYQVYTGTEERFLKIYCLLLAKFWLVGALTSFKRLKNKGGHYGIVEDLTLAGHKAEWKNGKPSPRKAVGERMMMHHSDDIYNLVPFVIMALVAKQTITDEVYIAGLCTVMELFLYGKLAQTLMVFANMPNIMATACGLFCLYLHHQLGSVWNFPAEFDGQQATHWLVLVMGKCAAVNLILIVYRALRGEAGPSDDELEHPERHWASEVQRVINIQRNDAENVPAFAIAVLTLGIGNVPYEYVFWFCAMRCVHTLVYLAHVPQPARAIAWISNVYFACKTLAMLL